MSASDKKKLRKELAAETMTKKQQQERKEAKKLKNISLIFTAVMLAIALTAGGILVYRAVDNSGVLQKNTIAAVINDTELNVVTVNYYFKDYVQSTYQSWYSTYGDSVSIYAMFMGLDLNQPLDDQIYDKEKKETWADNFLNGALTKAKSDYILYNLAKADKDFKLTEDEQDALTYATDNITLYAYYAGYADIDKYLCMLYGSGSDLESYKKYHEITTYASAYYNRYKESLKYDDAAIREYEKGKENNYLSFDYALYYVNSTDYLKGGTKDENGKTVYSDAEKDAALVEAKKVADELAKNKTLISLDEAIKALPVNKDNKDAAATQHKRVRYANILKAAESWLMSISRRENDITVVPNEVTSKDADGKEVKSTNGYYVLLFMNRDENKSLMSNVRHLLVKFQGGTTNTNGTTTYTKEEKAEAKAEAERLLKVWQDGSATEETFINLVKLYSDDNADAGGLYENIHADSPYVESFLNWSINKDRKVGDVELVESEYGYHIMYFVGNSEITYRDYMITEDLRADDVGEWYQKLQDDAKLYIRNTRLVNTDLIVSMLGY